MNEQHDVACEYRAIFDGTGDGILVANHQSGLIQDANPAMCRMVGYTRDELIGIEAISLIHPYSRPVYEERVRGQQMGGLDERVPLVGMRRDGTTVDVEVQVQTVALRGTLARLGVMRDMTERVRAVELLERRVRERTHELSAVLDVTQAVNSTLEQEPLLGLILDRLGTIVEYSEAAIVLLDGDELCISDCRGRAAREQVVGLRLPAASAVVFQAVIARDGPIIIDNLEGDDPLAVAYRAGPDLKILDPWLSPKSILAVPLRFKGQIIGELRLDHEQINFYRKEHADLAVVFANQVATAIVNARLFEAERLSREQLELALEAGQMGTWDWDKETGRVESVYLDVHPDDLERVKETTERSLDQGTLRIEYRIIRPDGQVRWLESRGQRVLDAEGNAHGMRGVCMDVTARKDAEEERNRLVAREQAAVEARVALEERHRLARELHDSVSQSLYGIGTAAQTARGALEDDHDAAAAAAALEQLIRMADAGLAEMRALISELRPETLAQEGLVAALERHLESIQALRHVRVDAQLGVEPDLPAAAKEALYRIAREALHNAIKHARVRSARLSMQTVVDTLILEVADDGVGFDPAGAYPGHLGLTSMAERARAAGGHLTINSAIGQGTHVVVQIPLTS